MKGLLENPWLGSALQTLLILVLTLLTLYTLSRALGWASWKPATGARPSF